MVNEFDRFGEFAPWDTPLPLKRGDLVDLLVGATTVRAYVLWAERSRKWSPPTADVITFYPDIGGLVISRHELLAGDIGYGITRTTLPGAIWVWLRKLSSY